MTALLLLIALWIVAIAVAARPGAVLAMLVLGTAGLLSMSSRLNPRGAILAAAALYTGLMLSDQEWAPYLAVTLGLVVVVVLVASWRPRPPRAA